MNGYDPNFLDGFVIPLPKPSPRSSLEEKLYVGQDGSTEIKHVKYSLVMNKEKRTPVFVAMNISQNELVETERKDNWRMDPAIPAKYQLGPEYYDNVKVPGLDKKIENVYDKGHLGMRQAAGWGSDAQEGADDTFYYTNCALQHKYLNRDEWLDLEKWTMQHDLDLDGRICEFSGPFFRPILRYMPPSTSNKRNADGELLEKEGSAAPIPSGFFKIVAYQSKEKKLEVRAFIIEQDEQSKANLSFKGDPLQVFQVTTAEVEELTGLVFDESLANANPLYHRDSPGTNDERNELLVRDLPERIGIVRPSDMVNSGTARTPWEENYSGVFISGALINPKGSDSGKEWVSIMNMSDDVVSLDGWMLQDQKPRTKTIEGIELQPGSAIPLKNIPPMVLRNTGGAITLLNKKKEIVDIVRYKKEDVKEGIPNLFHYIGYNN